MNKTDASHVPGPLPARRSDTALPRLSPLVAEGDAETALTGGGAGDTSPANAAISNIPHKRYSAAMPPWVVTVTSAAIHSLLNHADLVGLTNTEEFTFRSMFMAEVASHRPGIRFQTEWQKFDLLAQWQEQNTLIEFKYYLLRRTWSLDGSPGQYKGGAGPKNEGEFWQCVEKLATKPSDQIIERFLVLVYEREYPKRSRHSFHTSFGAIEPSQPVCAVWPLSHGPLEGRILKITPK